MKLKHYRRLTASTSVKPETQKQLWKSHISALFKHPPRCNYPCGIISLFHCEFYHDIIIFFCLSDNLEPVRQVSPEHFGYGCIVGTAFYKMHTQLVSPLSPHLYLLDQDEVAICHLLLSLTHNLRERRHAILAEAPLHSVALGETMFHSSLLAKGAWDTKKGKVWAHRKRSRAKRCAASAHTATDSSFHYNQHLPYMCMNDLIFIFNCWTDIHTCSFVILHLFLKTFFLLNKNPFASDMSFLGLSVSLATAACVLNVCVSRPYVPSKASSTSVLQTRQFDCVCSVQLGWSSSVKQNEWQMDPYQ